MEDYTHPSMTIKIHDGNAKAKAGPYLNQQQIFTVLVFENGDPTRRVLNCWEEIVMRGKEAGAPASPKSPSGSGDCKFKHKDLI